MKQYKSPILTSIFYGVGVLVLVAPIVLWVISGGHAPMAYPIIIGICASVIYFGIGQFFDLIGRLSHSNQCILETLPRIMAQLEKFDQRMAGSLPLNVDIPQPKVEVQPARPEKEIKQSNRFYYSDDGNQRGPVSVERLRSLKSSGRVNSDTPVCAEYGEEWTSLGEVLARTI